MVAISHKWEYSPVPDWNITKSTNRRVKYYDRPEKSNRYISEPYVKSTNRKVKYYDRVDSYKPGLVEQLSNAARGLSSLSTITYVGARINPVTVHYWGIRFWDEVLHTDYDRRYQVFKKYGIWNKRLFTLIHKKRSATTDISILYELARETKKRTFEKFGKSKGRY